MRLRLLHPVARILHQFPPLPPLLTLLSLLSAGPLGAQVTITGIADKTTYADKATFTVTPQAGYEVTASLDDAPAATGAPVQVTEVDYHELAVHWKQTASGTQGDQTVRFVVRASARASTETGLPPWTPYPMIPSAAAEFAGANLRIMVPRTFPQGLEIPVVAWIFDGALQRVGANGPVTAAEFPGTAIPLFRGVGSGLLPAAAAAGPLTYTARIQTLETPKTIDIDASTTWTSVSGTLTGATDWGEDARISVTGSITVPSGSTLTIGAGGVIRLAGAADIDINGRLIVNGTVERPVVFTPASRSAPWGGINFGFFPKTSGSQGDITAAIMTGGCANLTWFSSVSGAGGSHRKEQALVYLSTGAQVTLTDSCLLSSQGQASHGESAFLTMTRTLVQRFTTTGEFNSGTVNLTNSALIEFPADDAPFADADNDAIYLVGETTRTHTLTDCLLGWTRDDGIDGGGGDGPMTFTNLWIESTSHEGFAMSTANQRTIRGCVSTNCGQGIECGYGTTENVDADGCLSTANLTGARFGDSYDWDYNGSLKVTNSILIHNYRDVWGMTFDDWAQRLAQMDIHGNRLTAADPLHPSNTVWNPLADAALLAPFLPTPATEVGIGIALRKSNPSFEEIAGGVPVRLSTFTTQTVTVGWTIETDAGPAGTGTLTFLPGETLKWVPLDGVDLQGRTLVRVTLHDPTGGQVTGLDRVEAIQVIRTTLVPAGSRWKYRNDGVDQLTAWKEEGFNDTAWSEGATVLGDNGGLETTKIGIGPSGTRYWTLYFRRTFDVQDLSAIAALTVRVLRDDGAVVWINGKDAFRSNMPPTGTILFSTPASSSVTEGDETSFFEKDIDPAAFLQAGTNTIAVEVHQYEQSSSDLAFDLELLATLTGITPPARFIRGDANGDGSLDLADAVNILFVQFAGAATDCLDALDADDSGDLNITDAIRLLQYLFLNGTALPTPFPAAGEDLSADDLYCQRH